MALRLLPRDPGFLELFIASADHVLASATELTGLLGADRDERTAIADRVRDLELDSGDATEAILTRLAGAFVTPFDREDIHALALTLDGCVDAIDAACDAVVLYDVEAILPRVAKQVDGLVRMAELTRGVMADLRSASAATAYTVEMHRLENRANRLHRRLLAEFFAEESCSTTILKHKEVIDLLEAAADAFEQVAHRVQAIAIKGT